MNYKQLLFLPIAIGFFLPLIGFSQLQDDFSDGDFTNNPVWVGDVGNFEIDANKQLHSIGPAVTDTSYLSVFSDTINDAFWEVFVNMNFGTSSSNYTKIYVVSDQSNLKRSLNGYFVKIGGSTDEVSLYRQTGTVETKILDGLNGRVGTSTVNARIKVTRDASGNWELLVDSTGNSNYTSEGTINDLSFQTTSYFGVSCRYSSTRSAKFYFDDIIVSQVISDLTPPVVDSINVVSSTNIDVYFSEKLAIASAELATNYAVVNSATTASSATIDAVDSSLVHLTFSTAFAVGVADTLNVSNIQDRANNTMTPSSHPFLYFNTVPAVANDVVINEIFADPSPQVSLPSAEFVELRNSSSNVFDLNGWQFVNTSTAKTLPNYYLLPDSTVILCNITDTALYQPYGNVIGITSWTALSNSTDSLTLIDNNGTIIDVVKYQLSWYQDATKDNGGWSLEKINPTTLCGAGANNWIASTDASGGTPGKENAVYDVTPDVISPNLAVVLITDSNAITLAFDEAMDSLSLANGTYTFTNGLSVQSIAVGAAPFDSLMITLTSNIDTGITYAATVTGATDCPGNVIGTNTQTFVIGYAPQAGDVVFNEIFADPTPQVGLPSVEYVELYNKTNKLIDLENCAFDGVTIPLGTISANGYVVICPIADTALFASYGNVVGIASFPSLTNGGELLTFENAIGTLIDQVTYDISWYQDAIKDNGGWSLEKINPTTLCGDGATNWIASTDTTGGTPGAENSVYDVTVDVISPNLIAALITDSNGVTLVFDEQMDSLSLINGTYTFTNGLAILSSNVSSSPYDSLRIVFTTNIDTGITYTVTITNVTDCPGNAIGTNTGSFVVGSFIQVGDVVINEIFADPSPQVGLPAVEFVEIYNTTNQLLDLGNCAFDGVTIPAGIIDSAEYVILCPIADTALFSPFGKVIGIASFPSLTNGGELLTFENANGTLIDQVTYALSWYQDAIKDDGGWSLEQINPITLCGNGATNWIASTNPQGGTPGTQNAVFDTVADIIPPNLTSVTILDSNAIKISFSEEMDSLSLVNGIYALTNGLTVDSILVGTAPYDTLSLLFTTNIDTGITYSIIISNITDCPGNAIANNSGTFVVGFPLFEGDVIINEIFSDPTPQVGLPTVEFVELYNRTTKLIDLKNSVFDGVTIASGTIAANGYAIICPIADTALFTPFGNVIGLSSFPSLTNGGELLTLENALGDLINSVTYNVSWFNDNVKDNGGWSLELINPITTCSFASNWTASTDVLGGTPGAQNSVQDISPDNTAPNMLDAVIIDSNKVVLLFDEPMDENSLANGTYTVDNGLVVQTVQIDAIPFDSVFITFTTTIDTAILYTITGAGLLDCPNNNLADSAATFVIGYPASFGDLIFNEIMADPSPPVGMPNAEYVEIYNTTNRLIDLTGGFFDSEDIINTALIQPNGYLIICSVNDTAQFVPFGNTVGMNFPSLTNSGEYISIQNANGELIDEITFSDSWFNDPDKDNGGWSLERINPISVCNFEQNWAPADNFIGGTPGSENTNFDPTMDIIAPEITDLTVLSAQALKIAFNEPMDSTTLVNGTYTISNGITVASATTLGSPFDSVFLFLNSPIDTGITYTLTITNVTDCPGNVMDTINSINFILASGPNVGDVVINELFSDPSPIIGLPDQEFIELYNTTNQMIDLSNCKFDGVSFPVKAYLPPNSYVIICENQDVVLYESFGAVIGLKSWPSLTNSGETIELRNGNNTLVDAVSYAISWYKNTTKSAGGWTLERKNPFVVCNYNNNWSASEDERGGTPGTKNSNYDLTPDVTAPLLSKVIVIDEQKIYAVFNEAMDVTTLENGTYTISGIAIDSVKVDSTSNLKIDIYLGTPLSPGTIYSLEVSNITDCPGNDIGTNLADFVLPGLGDIGDIIINEILFNPKTNVSDYVEIYNNSEKYIDISKWSLANYDNEGDSVDNIKPIGGVQFVLFPQTYALLSKDTGGVKLGYPLGNSDTYLEMESFPSYGNGEGTVILVTSTNEVSDRFDYSEGMHFPLLNDVDGVSLERIDFNRTTNDYTNWHSAAEIVGYGTPGYENSQFQPTDIPDKVLSVEPEIFSPDGDGYNDVLNISFKMDKPGYVGTIQIYDANGRLVRDLKNNEFLTPEGTFSWDGTNTLNEKARIGIYIIYFTAYHIDGDVIKEKTTCVLATQL